MNCRCIIDYRKFEQILSSLSHATLVRLLLELVDDETTTIEPEMERLLFGKAKVEEWLDRAALLLPLPFLSHADVLLTKLYPFLGGGGEGQGRLRFLSFRIVSCRLVSIVLFCCVWERT